MQKTVDVQVDERGIGWEEVPYPPQSIEQVVCKAPHGNPHILPHSEPDRAWVEILGAIPDRKVTVSFNVSEG